MVDVTGSGQPYVWRYTKDVPFILRSNISFGWDGLHNARCSSLLSGQVALGGKTGITTLAPAGFEPVPSRTAVEHTDHSTSAEDFFCENEKALNSRIVISLKKRCTQVSNFHSFVR